MNTRVFALAVICAILAPYSAPQSLPLSERTNSRPVEAARAALQPWLVAIEALVSKTNDGEVRSYLQVLLNAALMAPSGEGGPTALAQRVLAPPPNTARPWIGVIVIDAHQDLPAGRWQQLASTADFAAEYRDDTNTIYLRSDIPQISVIRGLLIVHEMRHWRQAKYPATAKDSDSRLRKEVDAYQTEFRILDALGLPKYQELLSAERLRLRHPLAAPMQLPIQPEPNSPLLEQTFGRFPKPIATQMAAAEIAVRAAFAELDALPAELALRSKVDLLRSLGYQ